jgi:hypothetical protein
MGVLDGLIAPSLALDMCFDKTQNIGPSMELAHKLNIVKGVGRGVVWAEGEQRKGLRSHLLHAGACPALEVPRRFGMGTSMKHRGEYIVRQG